MSSIVLYLNAGLFNAGERLHTLFLERALKRKGYAVILPLREALTFFKDGFFDVKGIVADCKAKSSDVKNLCVGSVDGTDADSGTAIEYAFAIALTGRAINYRTDFRTDITREIGVNAMLNAEGTTFIYDPCYFTELDQVEEYYEKLADKIDKAVRVLGYTP